MTVTYQKRPDKVRREKPDLAPPIEYHWPTERYMQRLSSPRMPKPAGDGWRKAGKPMTDKTWTSRWNGRAYAYGPTGDRVQHWVRDRP